MDQHSPESAGPAAAPQSENTPGGNEPSFEDLMTEVSALGDHAAEYAAVKVDAFRARLRGLMFAIVLGVCGLLIALITISTLSFYTLRGFRGAIEAVTGRAWVADLLTGLLGLGGAAAGIWIYKARAARRARDRMVLKHEQRKSKHQRSDRHDPDSPARFAA